MTRHKTPFSVAPSPPPAKTAANFQLFGFSMMKIDHHHPSVPPQNFNVFNQIWVENGKRRRTSAGKLSEIQFGERRHFDLSTLRLLAHH